MYTCAACNARGKTWPGDDPVCGFSGEGKTFVVKNWNCATISELRNVLHEPNYKFCHTRFIVDQWISIVELHSCDPLKYDPGSTLWLTWYKSRGRLESAWILDSENNPRRPTEEDILAVINHYKKVTSNG